MKSIKKSYKKKKKNYSMNSPWFFFCFPQIGFLELKKKKTCTNATEIWFSQKKKKKMLCVRSLFYSI